MTHQPSPLRALMGELRVAVSAARSFDWGDNTAIETDTHVECEWCGGELDRNEIRDERGIWWIVRGTEIILSSYDISEPESVTDFAHLVHPRCAQFALEEIKERKQDEQVRGA